MVPMQTAVKPRTEPTERSMWRMTMISTMPVVITAMEEVWTSRIHRLRGVRKVPPRRPSPPRTMALARSKPTQITSSAPSMPSMRESISVALRKRVSAPSLSIAGFCVLSVAAISRPPCTY